MKKVANNSQTMKKNNRLDILNLLRKKNVSRAQLSRETGLTRAAISLIVDQLLEENIIFESSTEETELGRKPIKLQINEDSYYALGLDISRDHCYLGAIKINGQMIGKTNLDIGKAKDAYDALDIIAQKTIEIQDSLKTGGKLLGLGISAPGPIDIWNGKILNPPNFTKWNNVELVKYLKEKLKYDVFLDNNAIAQTLAEKYFGNGMAYHNYLVMMVNEGIGAGIVIHDKLYRGVDGFGNEIGHTSIDFNGRRCDCGNYGCLELYAGIAAVLTDDSLKEKGVRSWEKIVDKAIDGDKDCLSIIKKEAHYLSAAIVTCMNMLELEAVILKGSISYRSDLLLNELRDTVWSHTITRNCREKVPISISPDIKDNEIIAAATIVVDKYFSGEIF